MYARLYVDSDIYIYLNIDEKKKASERTNESERERERESQKREQNDCSRVEDTLNYAISLIFFVGLLLLVSAHESEHFEITQKANESA